MQLLSFGAKRWSMWYWDHGQRHTFSHAFAHHFHDIIIHPQSFWCRPHWYILSRRLPIIHLQQFIPKESQASYGNTLLQHRFKVKRRFLQHIHRRRSRESVWTSTVQRGHHDQLHSLQSMHRESKPRLNEEVHEWGCNDLVWALPS